MDGASRARRPRTGSLKPRGSRAINSLWPIPAMEFKSVSSLFRCCSTACLVMRGAICCCRSSAVNSMGRLPAMCMASPGMSSPNCSVPTWLNNPLALSASSMKFPQAMSMSGSSRSTATSMAICSSMGWLAKISSASLRTVFSVGKERITSVSMCRRKNPVAARMALSRRVKKRTGSRMCFITDWVDSSLRNFKESYLETQAKNASKSTATWIMIIVFLLR